MNKYLNYSLMLMLFGVLFASCADEYKSYTPATATTDQVYFSKELSHVFELSGFDVKEISIPVSRQKTDDEITVELGLVDANDFYTLKSKYVTFPEGASTANVVVTFDGSQLDYDEFPKATLYIADAVIAPENTNPPVEEEEVTEDEETSEASTRVDEKESSESVEPQYTTAWGDPVFEFSVGVPAPYESLGMGKFIDNFWEEGECDVEILRNTINPNIYRVVDPYGSFGKGYYDDNRSKFVEIQVLEPGDKVFDTEITKEDLVFFSRLNTGYLHSSYGAYVELFHPGYFYDDESTYLANKVGGYQEDGTPGEFDLAPYFYMVGVGGWNKTQDSGIVKVIFPGYTPKDYTLDITYRGIFTDTDEATYAVVAGEFGEDVENVKGVVLPGDVDLDAVADAIESGELEAVDLDITTPNNVNVPIAEDMTGALQVVLVVVDENGKVKAIASAPFEYYGKGDANPWVSLGTGLFVDNFVAPLYSGETPMATSPYEVEVLENKDTPGLYRVVKPFAPGVHPWFDEESAESYTDTNLEIDATDPDGVVIYLQSTGLDLGYGVISIASWGGYMAQNYDLATLKESGVLGTLSEGVITLPTFTSQSGTKYQGIHFDDDGGYYAGVEDGFMLVLPEAVKVAVRKRVASHKDGVMGHGSVNKVKVSKKSATLLEHVHPLDGRIK